jgi:hypothetical protein
MKLLILLTGLALFASSFISYNAPVSQTATAKKTSSSQQFTYFRAHRMANDISLNWGVSNPLEASAFTIMFSYDDTYYYELETLPANGSSTYRYRDVTALPGTTYYKIIVKQVDNSTVTSAVESVKIVKRG